MDYWKQQYPGNIFNINYEDLVSYPEEKAREILAFCELPWEDGCLDFYKAKATVNTPSATQVRKPMNKDAIARWKPYAKYLKPAADELGIDITNL